MDRDLTANNDFVSGLRAFRLDIDALWDNPDTRGVNKNLIGLAAVDHLGVAGDELHAGFVGRGAHRLHDSPKIFHRKSLLEDEADGEIERLGAAHGKVVDRAVHCHSTDIAARKEDWADDVGIRAEGEAFVA